MKKWVKIGLIILPIIIASGLSIYYYSQISIPWHELNEITFTPDSYNDDALIIQEGNNLFVGTNQKLKVYHFSDEDYNITFDRNIQFNVSMNQKLVLRDELLFTANNNWLYVYNFSNFENNGLLSQINLGTYIYDVEFNEDLIYISTSSSLNIVNGSDPSNLVLISQFNDNEHFSFGKHKIAYKQDIIYLTDGIRGLKVINVSNPSSPSQIYQYFFGIDSNLVDVTISKNYVAVVDARLGFVLLQEISPGNYVFLGNSYASMKTQKMEIHGNFTFICEGLSGFRMISILSTDDIFTEVELDDHTSYYDFIYQDNRLIILHSDGISVYEIVDGIGPNPMKQAVAIQVITGFLQVLAYLVLAVVLFILVKRSKIL